MHSIFDLAFVPGGLGHGRADQKAIVQGQPPVGFAQHRVVDQGLQHRRFKIVRHHPFGHSAKALEGSPVQP